MLRSMYSGINAMKNFQVKLDVIGNNIANVNTYGFKKGRTIFQDLISQTISGASAPSQGRGGTNPRQVGLGSQLAAIDTIHTTGSTQPTGRVLDLAISGDGFFQVAESADNTNFTNVRYTRAGNFYLDKDGYLVTSDGYYVVGFAAYLDGSYDPDGNGSAPSITTTISPAPKDINISQFDFTNPPTYKGGLVSVSMPSGATFDNSSNPQVNIQYKPIKIPTDAQSVSIGQDGSITYVDRFGTLRWAGQLVLAKFPNNGGLEKAGANLYRDTPNSGTPILNFAGAAGIGAIQSGALEMSNVDLAEEFTEMIVAQRGFQANTRIITTSDEILQELVNLKK
ncbi:flagellar basal-body rod protein FlgG [Parageobacillus thermoglucosidasius]|uniref:flagellar basal-body rod protein FlgG n=1 Tax=Parageobacillus thermoglucosidasius TaxID=1426 RepID=UPI000B57FAB8|nr:flagellar basal-body rod protein FlgG [Parageobacillus thermoglucosidasius]MBY6267665.1 flagellar basal body rod protein FlgG [Parageobacillus thermoglucosidasius]OUM94323.1 MAG: flagellar basal body rod protein FlgG [Parageobacillus thermoglucosidasius]